jgi:mannose-6-phosphate isomerase-like protein (cupin superfamily)
MVASMQPLVHAPRATATEWFADELVAAATAPAGQVAMVERKAGAGHMPPLARRSEPETYRVLEGEVVFLVGSDMVWARAGDVVVAPRDVPCTFRVASTQARWLVLTRVRSLERFHDFGRAVAVPRQSPGPDWPSPEERAAVAAMAAANGIELLGPPGALPS